MKRREGVENDSSTTSTVGYVAKEVRRIDGLGRGNDGDAKGRSEHKVATDHGVVSFTQWPPIDDDSNESHSHSPLSGLAVILLADWTTLDTRKHPSFRRDAVRRLRRVGRVVAVRWPFHSDQRDKVDKSNAIAHEISYPMLVDATIKVVRSLRKFKKINVVVPVCVGHAGWIGVRLIRRLPRIISCIAFVDWSFQPISSSLYNALSAVRASNDRSIVKKLRNIICGRIVVDDADKYEALLETHDNAANDESVDEAHRRRASYQRWIDVGHEVERSFNVFTSPANAVAQLGGKIRGLHVRLLEQCKGQRSPSSKVEDTGHAEEDGSSSSSLSDDDDEEVGEGMFRDKRVECSSYEWLRRVDASDGVQFADHCCAFIRSCPLPPSAPTQPVWNSKIGSFSWKKNVVRRNCQSVKRKTSEESYSLHFFLLPEVIAKTTTKRDDVVVAQDVKSVQHEMEDELDAAIDEGRPYREHAKLAGKALGGAVVLYGAALLLSAPVVLTATAAVGAKKAYDRYKTTEDVDGIVETATLNAPLKPNLSIKQCTSLEVHLAYRLAMEVRKKILPGWPLLPDRTYAVCATRDDGDGGPDSPYSQRVMWTCPSAPSSPPIKLAYDEANGSMPALRWDASSEDPCLAFEVRYGLNRWLDLKWTNVISETPSLHLELRPSTAYVAEVRAISPGGVGPWSARLKFTTSSAVTKNAAMKTDGDDEESSDSGSSSSEEGVGENDGSPVVEFANV